MTTLKKCYLGTKGGQEGGKGKRKDKNYLLSK